MSRPVKVILTIVVLAALAAAVTGVAYWSMDYDPDHIEPGLYVKERRISDPGIMLTIGDNEVPFEVYRHYFLVSRNMFTMYYGETIWEDDLDGDRALVLRDAVESELVNLYAWLQIAEETGVSLTEDDYAELEATLAEQKEQLGDDFPARLEEMGFSSEESYLEISAMQQLSSKVQTEYNESIRKQVEKSAGDKAEQEYLDDYITAKHILVAFDTEEEDTEKAEADALAKAEDLMDQLLAAKTEAEANAEPPAEGEDGEEAEPTVNEDFEKAFDELMFANTDDLDGTEANPDGYTFKEGDMVEEFYEGALALGVGEMSEPIKTTYGYHIILRLPLDTTGLEEYKESAISTEVSNKVAEKTAEVKEGLPVVGGPYYDGLTPYSIY